MNEIITMEWPRRYLSIALPHNYPLWCVIAFRADIICYNLPGCHTTYSLRTLHLLLFISTPEIHRETSNIKTNRMREEGILIYGGISCAEKYLHQQCTTQFVPPPTCNSTNDVKRKKQCKGKERRMMINFIYVFRY